jgi:hypothetical protein
MEVSAMASLPSPFRACKSDPPAVTTGTLTTAPGEFLDDLLHERAVLTLRGPAGERSYWLAVVVEGGRVVDVEAREFDTGEVTRVRFEGVK